MKVIGPVTLASRNPGKLRELRALCEDVLDLRMLPEDVETPVVVENADTYVGNALLKARAFAERSGGWALADDSGLEVDALGGAPGVLSARYGGERLSDRDRCDLLLAELAKLGVGVARTARFRCVVVVAGVDGEWCSAEGVLEGRIAEAARGAGGFGYDPVFVPGQASRVGFGDSAAPTLAEIAEEEKNRISHRAEALRRLLAKLGDS